MTKDTAETQSKTATRAANTRTKKAKPAEEKAKRPPSAYNLFVKSKMTEWKEANPDKPHKEAMAAIARMWKDAPENPNRGGTSQAKPAKAPKKVTNKDAAEKEEEEEEATAEDKEEEGHDEGTPPRRAPSEDV